MAVQVMTDAKIYVGGYNLSGFSNEAHLSMSPAILDASVFGGGSTRRNVPGLIDFKLEAAGFMDYVFPIGAAPLPQTESFNSALFAMIDDVTGVGSIAPLGNAEGDLCYTTQQIPSKFDPLGGAVGSLLPFKLEMNALGVKVIRGTVGGLGLKTVTGNSATGIQLGAVSATQRLYCGLHVVGASGTTPTLDVIVRSSTVIGMAAPTTRLTFSQFTTLVGASWQSIAGPITDTFFDVKWTIAGTTPNYVIFVVIGIL